MNTLLYCVLTAAAPAASSEPEWPAYKGDAGLTGLSAEAIEPPLKLAWTYRLDGDASSDAGAGVTVAGGKVFINIHNTRSILALDARTGRFAWEYHEPIGYMNAPTYADGKLFLWQRYFKKTTLVVLDAKTGKEVRKQPLEGEGRDPHRAGLPVADGKVYCSEGGEEPAVTAFDIKDGAQVWRTGLGKEDGGAAVCPIAAGGRIFVATRDHHASKKS